MRILLVGEYSRLHNSLKEGLIALGHKVTLVATGDYFKDFPADIKLKRKFESGFLKLIKGGLYRFFTIDLASISLKNQFMKHQNQLKGFDVVQLINESPFAILPKYEREIIAFLHKKNKKLFLLSCGTDHISVKYAADGKFKYSLMTPYREGKITKKSFFSVLKYLQSDYINHHHYVYQSIQGVIASDLDYHIPLQKHVKYLGLIPNPINTDLIKKIENPIHDKIIIFHGINRANYYKKGNDLFEQALLKIQKTHAKYIEVIVSENVPYTQYIDSYNKAHIVLDQVYSYDQGYNALEAMAKGKVVFTGAEPEFLQTYHVSEDEVCINALPDVDYLVIKLIQLIEDPKRIQTIGDTARKFIEQQHDYRTMAQKYINTWM